MAMLSLEEPDRVIGSLRAMANEQVVAPGGQEMYAFDFAARRDTAASLAISLGMAPITRAGEAARGLVDRAISKAGDLGQAARSYLNGFEVRGNPFLPDQALSTGNSFRSPPQVRAFYNGVEIDPKAARINPELSENFIGPIDPKKIFRRVASSSQSLDELRNIIKTNELWGGGNYKGDVPSASALRGFLPPGVDGLEFVTAYPLKMQSNKLNGQVNWSYQQGMREFTHSDGRPMVGLPIVVIRSVIRN